MRTDELGAVDITVIGHLPSCARAVSCRRGESRGKLAHLGTETPSRTTLALSAILFVLFAWVRSVRVRPDIVLSIAPRDLNIVVERQLDQMLWYQRQ
jgi:hypothetical protein